MRAEASTTSEALLARHEQPAAAEQVESQPIVDFELMRDLLSQQVELVQRQFQVKHRNLLRWADKQGYRLPFLTQQVGKAMMAGGLMLSLLTSTPQSIAGLPAQAEVVQAQQAVDTQQTRAQQLETAQAIRAKQVEQQQALKQQILQLTQQNPLTADPAVNDQAAQLVRELTSVPSTAVLDGYRLNTAIGRIGAEQHLKRFPGDTLAEHEFTASGMAPGLGAYGYFAPSRDAMTPEIVAREQYYVAVQTFLSPNWNGNVHQAYNWFKYRKVLVYHPVTGKAVVAVVGDAGPAKFTGKAFGGSPEVMAALGAVDGRGTPPVVLTFVDDPENKVPLGPVHFAIEAEGAVR